MNITNTQKKIKAILDLGVPIATILGLFLGYLQLEYSRKSLQQDQYYSLVEKQSEMNTISSELYRDFDLSEAFEILKNSDNVKKDYEEFLFKFTYDTKEGQDRYQKMLILANYYNGIASCVESELCERKTAEVLFQTEGKVFFENYHPFFCHLNEKWKDRLVEPNSVKFYDLKYENNKYYEHLCNFSYK